MFEGSIAKIRGMILDSNISKCTVLEIGLIYLLLEAHATLAASNLEDLETAPLTCQYGV